MTAGWKERMEVWRDDKIHSKCFEINQKVVFCAWECRQNYFTSSVVNQTEIYIFGHSGQSNKNLPQSWLHSSSTKNPPQSRFTPQETSQQCHHGFTTHIFHWSCFLVKVFLLHCRWTTSRNVAVLRCFFSCWDKERRIWCPCPPTTAFNTNFKSPASYQLLHTSRSWATANIA